MKSSNASDRSIGVFICHCGGNISDVVDIDSVVEFAKTLPNVSYVCDQRFMCSLPAQEIFQAKVAEENLDAAVIASCTPKMYEEMFRGRARDAGMNPYLLEIANIREQCSYPHRSQPTEATRKAKLLIAARVEKVRRLEPLSVKTAAISKGVAVVGAGIAGIHAALQLADLGHEVHLIEKEPTIGGNMARLVKTFPTDDCAMCTLSPKMNEVAQHPRINLLTYAEIRDVIRSPGSILLKVEKKPRYVTEDCVGCNRCTEKCPTTVSSEWDFGIFNRKAIYQAFPQAVPRRWTIDRNACRYFQTGKCRVCEKVCPADAIDFEMEPEEVAIEVGALILATGSQDFDPTPLGNYGYGRYPEVITQFQMARMLDLAGQTEGKVVRPNSGDKPARRVVMIQCVGSRAEDDDIYSHKYCSRVCCMAAIKHANMVVKSQPGTEVYVLYNDIRAFGKGYEEYYTSALKQGVKFIKGIPSKVIKEGDKMIVPTYDAMLNRFLEIETDLVVLSTAVEPNDVDDLLHLLRVEKSTEGFIKEFHLKIRPTDTTVKNVFVCGMAQGPKDITDSIAQAGSAAMSASVFLGQGEMELSPLVAEVNKELCRACGRCEEACQFEAISIGSEPLAQVDETLCEGCGRCSAICPTGAVQVRSFRTKQVHAELDALVGRGDE